MNSMYLSIVTYSGLGDSAMYAHNPVETLFISLFCLLNVFMAAYVLGEALRSTRTGTYT